MRWALAGLLAAGGLIIVLCLGWAGLGGSGWVLVTGRAAEQSPWQVRELNFLKAAYDRLQQDTARRTDGSASLRAEQERVVRQMVETVKLLPIEAVPAELRELLPRPEAAPSSLPPEARPTEARLVETPPAEWQPPDLRVGLRAVADGEPPVGYAAEFGIDPSLREPVRYERAVRAPRRKPREDASGDQRSGR